MIHYLIDSSAMWRILRQPRIRSAWEETISLGMVGSCDPQRAEFRRSARNLAEYDDMTSMFADLHPNVAVPKSAWRWIDAAQYRLAREGALRALSVVDLLICATAAPAGLTIVHDDSDFETAASVLADVSEVRVHLGP